VEDSDILALHAPLNEGTKGLISREVIGRMRHGSYLVNTARSSLVDEDALLDALKEGRLYRRHVKKPAQSFWGSGGQVRTSTTSWP
jgi:phosphoglycerate dehydrogenase-like enzyme